MMLGLHGYTRAGGGRWWLKFELWGVHSKCDLEIITWPSKSGTSLKCEGLLHLAWTRNYNKKNRRHLVLVEGFKDRNIPFLEDCHHCAKFLKKHWSDDTPGWDCCPQCALRKCKILVATLLGLEVPPKDIYLLTHLSFKIKVSFLWGSKKIKKF